MIAVTAEALSRGEVRESQASGTAAWLREHAPSLRQGGAKVVADCAELLAAQWHGQTRLWHEVATPAGDTGIRSADGPEAGDPATDLTPTEQVCRAVLSGALTPTVAVTVLSETQRLGPRWRPEAHPTVAAEMIALGCDWGTAQVRRLRPRLLAEYGVPGELQADHEMLARFVTFTFPTVVDGHGGSGDRPVGGAYTQPADGRARPAPRQPTPRRSPRPGMPPRHRPGDHLPGAAKTALFVTVDFATLRDQLVDIGQASDTLVRAGTVVGTPAAGLLLAPETIRRLVCDAELSIPPQCSDPTVSYSTWARRCACSPRRRPEPSGCEIATATSQAAPPRPAGATRTTSSTGPTAARSTSTTRHCCASATTRSCTTTGSSPD